MAINVGQVAGLINLAIVIVQVTAPLALSLVLLGSTGDKNNAVTWSVISRTLQGTLWPTFLRSDSAATKDVQCRVNLISHLGSIVPVLLVIAGIVTPLGLSSHGISATERPVSFTFAPDTSDFGRYSVRKSEHSFNRACGYREWIPCPGSLAPLLSSESNGTLTSSYAYGNTSIAENISTIFSSGTACPGNTISSMFDMRFRQYRQSQDVSGFMDNGRPRTIAQHRFTQPFIQEHRLHVIDGLVIDNLHGGVGFRNHTVPIGLPPTTSWIENLLWVEPITSCVNLNISVEFRLDRDGKDVVEAFLVNDGGFNSHPLARATYDNPKAQDNPDLFGRALHTAVYGNTLIAQHFNISHKHTPVGAKYKLPLQFARQSKSEEIWGPSKQGDYVRAMPRSLEISRVSSGWIVKIPGLEEERNGVSAYDLIDLERRCGRVEITDRSGINTLAIQCHLLLTAPTRVDGGDDMVDDAHSVWRHGGFACATALRATVKEVEFSYSPGGDPDQPALQNLHVNAAREKEYPEGKDIPLWAVEESGLSASEIQPFWGIIDVEYASSEAIKAIRREYLYLPGHYVYPALVPEANYRRFAVGSTAAGAAYDALHLVDILAKGLQFDYSGGNNLALLNRWKELSKDTESIGQIPNLIWTDMFANSVTGTKSQISSRNSVGKVEVTVVVSEPRVLYNLLYSIPAIVLFLIWATMGLVAAVMWASSRVTIPRLRRLSNRVSTGRAVVNVLHPDLCEPDASTKVWIAKAGSVMIDFGVDCLPPPTVPISSRQSAEVSQASLARESGATSSVTSHSVPTSTAPLPVA